MAGDPSSSADSGRSSGDAVLEWEIGLPTDDDLTPLSQSLVPPELASAFSISPEPLRTMLDVYRASQNTLSGLRLPPSNPPFPSFYPAAADDPMVVEADEPSRKSRRPPDPSADDAAADSLSARPDASSNDDHSACTLKRPRLVWTPQLHKRFVDVVAHLGIKNAVPKTIMQLMNVEGLTRENVASHLQKYRLYLRRMQGLSNEGPSSSDHLFASTPVPQSLHEPLPPMPVPVPYAMPTMMPVPVYGMVPVQGGGHAYRGFETHHPYGEFGERPKDWPSGNNFGPIVSYPRVTPNDK